MRVTVAAPASTVGAWRILSLVAAGVVLAASLVACNDSEPGTTSGERVLELEAKVHSQEESLEASQDENSRLKEEIAALGQEQAEYVERQDAAQAALKEEIAALGQAQAEYVERQDAALSVEEHEEEVADFEEEQARTSERLDDLDGRMQELEESVSKLDRLAFSKEDWPKLTDRPSSLSKETDLERTRKLAEAAGGGVYNIDSLEPKERAILMLPPGPIDGNPLIVSLHGFGGNSADHSMYFPLHQRATSHGFGLLLPNGSPGGEGNLAWNPTDLIGSPGKASADDFAYLAGLVARAREVKDFGPVYLFGYSNGGFMSYHMACKGLPGLRAVVSIAGTSYYEDSDCAGAPPVSVLHIHGTADDVILFDCEKSQPDPKGDSEAAFYSSAHEMLVRWGQRAGCEWSKHPEQLVHYAILDLDLFVSGPETYTFRLESGFTEGINIELWMGADSGHSPGYLHGFVDALLDWLLSQK